MTETVENDDNDADTGTNAGRVKVELLYSYFVRQVYACRCPTAHSHPCKLTSKLFSFVRCENHSSFELLRDHPRYLLRSYLGGLVWCPEFG